MDSLPLPRRGSPTKREREAPAALDALDELREIRNDDPEMLVQQLLYYSAHADHLAGSMVVAIVDCPLRISKSVIVRAVMPHIEYLYPQDDIADTKPMTALRGGMRMLLEFVNDAHGEEEPDYKFYKSWIRNHEADSSPNLVRYMYDKASGAALLTMSQVYSEEKDEHSHLVWSDHVISDAIWKKEHSFEEAFQQAKSKAVEQLEKLVQQEQWWARLYAAEILHRHPEFRTPEMMQRLQNDEHNLVRQAITETESGAEKPNRPPVQPADADGGQQQ
jgi:hypothetical protein